MPHLFFFAFDRVRRPLSDEVVAIGPLACLDWNACLEADEGISFDFLALDSLDWVGSLLSDEVGSWSESVEAGSMVAAFFFAMRAALASAARFFFAHLPMVDKKDKQVELNCLRSSHTTSKLVLVHKPFQFEVEHCLFFCQCIHLHIMLYSPQA